MARRITPKTTGIVGRADFDQFGRSGVPGAAEWLTDRRLRRVTRGRNNYVHRTPNGHKDPFSFWHLVDALLNIDPFHEFSSRQLTDWLNETRPQFIWDAVTVGRMLSDIVESCEMANSDLDAAPLLHRRNAAGSWYQTNNQSLAGQVLRNILEDLETLCEKLVEEEGAGMLPKRHESPLMACASVMEVAA